MKSSLLLSTDAVKRFSLPHLSGWYRRAAINAEAVFKYTVPAVRRYQLDLAKLSSLLSKVVLASVSAGQTFLPSQCTVALAERLGANVTAFPSHHTGYITHPRAFTERLREVLSAEPGK